MKPLCEDVYRQLADPLGVADRAVDHQSRASGVGGDCGAEVVADKGAADDLPEELDDEDVAGHEGVDDPRVLPADPAFPAARCFGDLVEIRAMGDVPAGHGAPGKDALRMEVDPLPFELEVVLLACQNPPGLLGRHLLHPFQDVIGNPGAPVPGPVPAVFDGQFANPFCREQFHRRILGFSTVFHESGAVPLNFSRRLLPALRG